MCIKIQNFQEACNHRVRNSSFHLQSSGLTPFGSIASHNYSRDVHQIHEHFKNYFNFEADCIEWHKERARKTANPCDNCWKIVKWDFPKILCHHKIQKLQTVHLSCGVSRSWNFCLLLRMSYIICLFDKNSKILNLSLTDKQPVQNAGLQVSKRQAGKTQILSWGTVARGKGPSV